MLQRKVVVCDIFVLFVALLIYVNPALSQLENNEFGEVKPTPVLKANQDVATVLVADINNRAAHGRFINIKPEIGLLKSTARTFIQDGIKTEYVTKVIGSTIDNGQYVQLLTTTSRVLYNSDAQQTTKTVNLNLNAIDGNDDSTFINSPPSSPFLQNVDYIVPNNPYLVFPARNSRNNNNNEIVNNFNSNNLNDNENEESEIAIKAEKLVDSVKLENPIAQPAKVIPEGSLPTYTVSHDGPIFQAQAPQANSAPRVGKVITYEEELKEVKNAPKVLPSVTYFGFADFTTTVGDTIIIFSPSTAKPQIDKDHITSIKGEPTLNIQPTSTKQQHITFESAEPSKPRSEEPRFTPKIVETALPTLPTTPKQEETTTSKDTTTTSTTTESTTEEVQTTTDDSSEEEEEEESSEQTDAPITSPLPPTQKPIIRVVGITTPETIESSEVPDISTPKYSKPSEDDVQRILASLAQKAAQSSSSSVIDTSPIVNSDAVAETRVLTGSSIIFFDDDEFDITTQKTQIPTLPPTTTTSKPETTTEESEEEEDDEDESTTEKPAVEIKPLTPKPEEKEEVKAEGCSSTISKTLTFLTTFYIPIDEVITTTSIKTSQAISSSVIAVDCSIKPTSVIKTEIIPTTQQIEKIAIENEKQAEITTEKLPETTTMEIVTESSTIEEETTVENLEDEEDIEIIYKTLYTTYTYLTTFFQESTSTVSSRKEVVTNIVTSTINANDFASLLNQFEPSKALDEVVIEPTQVDTGVGRPTEKFILPENDFIGVNQLLDNEKVEFTPALSDDDISNEIKTLYTTYTYFTTLFNEGKSEIATRTEVYTNIINPSSSLSNILQKDLLETKQIYDVEKDENSLNPNETKKEGKKLKLEGEIDGNEIKYSTMIRNASELVEEAAASSWDDVKTSTSDGERSYIENIDRRHFNVELEDQISSESNTEEGIPSPTLLLQTRYTTFTYYTTVYSGGSSSSNILSRLETLTNVVTETLAPTQVQKLDDATVPVTYFTTFTYWTTFYKDGKTETTSREETVSNVITPSLAPTEKAVEIVAVLPTHIVGRTFDEISTDSTLLVQPLQPVASIEEKTASSEVPETTTEKSVEIEIEPSSVNPTEPQTLYTTFTYYTTNYVGDETVIDSRFETETNIVTPSVVLEQKTGARAIDINAKGNALDSDEKKPKDKVAVVDATPALVNLQPTGIVSINHGKIQDAEGITTTHFTTKAIGQYVDGLYAEVIDSSSSIEIDEIRKAIQPTEIEGATRHHKTGLVRLIDGTIVNKNQTTLYESKIIGTFIDGRYAQLIESTSSIILAKQIEPSAAVDNRVNIEPTAVLGAVVTPSDVINPTPAVLEGSISDSSVNGDEEGEEDDDDDSKASLPGRKKSFTPVIRPFASRPRPSFNPKRKNAATNGPAIITPVEITPTIKATAVKSVETSRNRFAGGRRSSGVVTSAFSPSSASANVPTGGATSSRRTFGRPSSVRSSIQPTASVRPSKATSSRIQPTSALPSGIRRPLLRSSLPISARASSAVPSVAIGRNRVRPTAALDKSVVQPSVTTSEPDEFETTLITEEPETDVENESQEPITTTTTENSRRSNNPLLKVRRPPFNGARPNAPAASTQRPSATITTRRNPLARTTRVTTQATTTTTTERTTRSRPLFRPSLSPVVAPGSRARPSNLFPPRRSTTQAPQAIDEEEVNNSEEDYNEYEESKIKEVKTPAARSRGGRIKRQALDYGTRSPNYNPRFKRPTTSRNSRADYYTYDSEELIVTEAPKTRATSRYSNQRARTSSNFEEKIKPTPTTSSQNNRLLFTLRKEDTSPAVTSRTSNFRRPSPANNFSSGNRRTTPTTRTSNKFRYHQDSFSQSSRSGTSSNSNRSRASTRNRGTTSRSRSRDDTFNYVAPKFDGTITVTHHIPTEVTIPVVNGKNTEYKMVITAKPSTEILGPKQYSTNTGINGQTTLVIIEEKTFINAQGATEITQYYLSETPTTSITFTPTTIRGRKTSFSHIVPSTIYDAHPVVSTIQPQLVNNAPLANILLSQLLLNGFNQPNPQVLGLNPLLGLNQQQVIPQMPATPVTEFKTRTTTYVTTIHEGKSTVLPVTFRGMKIYTTVYDEQSTVITATEFITDTVVIQPTQTALPQVPQLNSLLLPLLLNQQTQQQQQPNIGLQNINTLPNSFDILKREELESIPLGDDKLIQSVTKDEIQQNSREEDYEDEKVEEKPKKPKFKVQAAPKKKFETSVVTLYISGRSPGDFSTVLSTIVSENPVQKRSAPYVDVKASALPNLDVLEAEASNNYYEYVLSGSSNDIDPEARDQSNKETESLDVVFGDYSRYSSSVLLAHFHIISSTLSLYHTHKNPKIKYRAEPKNLTAKPEEVLHRQNGRKFTKFAQHHVNEGGGGGGGRFEIDGTEVDEARYNLATRVMSNGVELIVADGKSTFPGEPNFFRILTNSKNYNRPLTLAPSTLNNKMMLMTLGGKSPKIDNIPENAILNRFVTKTCLTTYTYLTTYEMNGSTMIESREKVISNIATEERNTHNLTPLIASDMTFFKTPNLRVGEFSTTYTYYNTIMDDDIPIVATSKHVVVNTITAADDYLKMIQPTPSASPVYETNTYYSTVEFSKTINDDEMTKVINTRDVVTQVIVTESLPHGRMPMSMSHDLADSHESDLAPSDDYDETEDDDENYIKRTSAIDVNPTIIDDMPNDEASIAAALPLHIYATKTYLTTFTYFTTLLQNGANVGGEISSTIVDSHTRVIENVITESIPSSLVPDNVLTSLSRNVIDDSKSDMKTRITLKNGQKLEITAANILKPVDYATKISSVETNDLDVAANDLSPVSALFAADESENDVEENIAAESNDEQQQQEPIRVPTIQPRPKPASGGSLKIPSLLNSISMPSLPSFSALGPVINAMAGILQSNFNGNKVQVVKSKPEHETLPQPLPLFSQESQDAILSQTESKNKVPLYIPIREPNHHTSMMGSGIPISPGDVITANSDVIVGRPAVIGPKLPSVIKNPEEIQGMEAPPPFIPLKTPQRPSSFVKDIKSTGNINQLMIKKGDDYIGPPPPHQNNKDHISQQHKPIPLTNYARQPIPQNLQKIQPILPPMLQRPANILLPKPTPTQESQINNHFVKINHQQPHKVIRNQQNVIPLQQQHQQHHFKHSQINTNPTPLDVIEIQKIPEVYSTDLPIITVNHHQNRFQPSSTHSDIIAHELPEILDKPTNGQPLLVDIQPSQVANVVIPHDSSSVLVFGGVHEQHKAGQYFNDPPPHAGIEIGIKSVNLLADVQGGNLAGGNNKNIQPAVHYDVKDNIIVASDSVIGQPSNVHLHVSPLNPSIPISRPSHEYLQNSVHFSPSSVVTYNHEPSINYKQQLWNQQKEQQIAIDNQLKQKQIENQKRIEIENQKRQEFIQRQKFIEQQKRKEYEEQQQRQKQIEMQRKQEYERQQMLEQQRKQEFEKQQMLEQQRKQEYERQKQLEAQRKQEYERQQQIVEQQKKQEFERQKQIELQRKQEFERQQMIEQQQKKQAAIELQKKFEFENQKRQEAERQKKIKNQIILPHRMPVRPEIPIPHDRPQQQQQSDSGFIVLTSNYNSQNQPQNSFIPLPPSKHTIVGEVLPDDSSNADDEVQESINRPKLPSGENHDEIDDLKDIEEYDNFVYHKITSTTTEQPQTTRLITTTSTTRRSSVIPLSTERTNPIYKPKPHPNYQFENLPILVNDLQQRQPTNRPSTTVKTFHRVPIQFGNTISQAMKPPPPAQASHPTHKITRRPTHPFINKTTFKISMPIDPMPDDINVINNLQTESPFNPIYTQSTTNSETPKSVSKEMTTTSTIPTTTLPITEEPTTISDLNIGEIEPIKMLNFIEENAEVFDSKETNHGYANRNRGKDDFDLIPPSNKNEMPYHTINRVPDLTTYKTTNVKLEISSTELETMRPPAPSTKGTTKAPSFEDITIMKPPEIEVPKLKPQYVNIQRPTISLSRFTPSNPDPLNTTTRSKTTATTFRPPFRNRFTTAKPIELEVVKKEEKEEESKIINSTPTLPTVETEKLVINTTPTIIQSTLFSVSSTIRKEQQPRRNRTVVNIEQTITSTKLVQVTNTKTITLSSTKTETIHHSRGVPIVTTSVHTVFETITETETLLKPTVITSIHPTKTIIREKIIPTAYQTTTEEIVEGFVSSEDLDEFIINDFDNKNGSIVRVNSKETEPSENDSIFVVVKDKNHQQQKINIDPSIINPSLFNQSTFLNEIEDVSRGEEENTDGAGHILLGGILIASPPQLNKTQQSAARANGKCYPECNKVNNEYCHRIEGLMRCVCRPGFARMFPDRPCKPIYTYIMKIPLNRIGREKLSFDPSLENKTSSNYTNLQETTYNGVDRMLMQSDLRDIYHSVEVIGFNKSKENGITGKLFIQLSENTNEKKLRETVKKYLRLSNFNLGGTELYANPLVTDLETYDFDECEADKSHDCSEFSHCFNLLGTYTCSCMEGYADESENPIYPGRICMKELVGCEKCHYHGTCITKTDDQIACECFQWYTGQQCQVSLKLLLFGLIVTGLTLFMLLMICIIITCVKKKRVNQNAIGPAAMNIIQRRISSTAHHSVSSNADRKAMIQDTSSEASEGHDPAPYFRKKSADETQRKISVEAVAPKKKKSVINNPLGSFSKATTVDQRDRSLTVMIPRAKYHPALTKNDQLIDVEGYKSKSNSNASINQTKLLNYLDASPSTSKAKNNVPCEKQSYQPQNPGALVSAGFKVSAAGGGNCSTSPETSNKRLNKTSSHQNVNEMGSKYYAVHKISTVSDQPIMSIDKSQISVVRKSYSHGNLMESMDDWLDNGNNTEVMSEARSYDETTIQAPTKAIRNLYYKQMSQHDGTNTEDMNTMAERDMASTVLLPHTHLYKPTNDRASDISGFDSL
ncbi:hypothetical protein PVAND_013068 [Polypedilum vanderplanki]|uniref:EGF-like domain-containing protein n=1 Tax=Polypedilum vanderplanki TaxID=319348 RepID=A0A9J6CPI1_POLVA|nr:hypothetical protein PVAND_013068 [Polypedilum vanderplanki]